MASRKKRKPRLILLLMEIPINDKELNTIVSALRLGGDAALYQKLNNIKESRKRPSNETNDEQFGFVL